MATFEIYYGAEKPIRAVGKNQVKLLQFAEKFSGCWRSFKKDRATIRAVKALESKKCFLVDWNASQFKFIYP